VQLSQVVALKVKEALLLPVQPVYMRHTVFPHSDISGCMLFVG